MKKIEIAKKFKLSNSNITDISKGRRHTKNKELALHIAAITGKRPIDFIDPSVREAYKTAYPILLDRVREIVAIVKR